MQESHTAFLAGQHVVVRDERWTILRTESFESTCLLRLRGIDPSNRGEMLCALAPFERVTRLVPSARIRQGSRRRVMARAVDAVAAGLPWDQCWTAPSARIDLHEWQLEPAMAAVGGSTRVLLADGVGLGKTIQAGLIIAELGARQLADRVLVLTPAAIREQWQQELSTKFALPATVFDHTTLAAAAAALPPDVNPWRTVPIVIASIDLVKRGEVRAALRAAPFDVLIVDEAHHLTPGSDRASAAAELALRTPWVVLVTATPHSGDDAAYRFLTSLGQTDGAPLRVFRRSRAPRDCANERRSRLVHVWPTEAERLLLTETRAYVRALSRGASHPGARLLGSVIARRAASSAAAAARTLGRRIALLTDAAPLEQQPALPWPDVDEADDHVDDAVLAAPGLSDADREVEWLRLLARLAGAARHRSSKLGVIRRLIRRTNEPMLIFSEYRDVVIQVADGLADLCAVAMLHGGQSPRERLAAVTAFTSGAVRVLVATDAAGEGLNLHARCRLVINLELPWAPLRLEQRIGRVDRMGQARRVHALHLAHRDSYESTVIARLERRRLATLHASDDWVGPSACSARTLRRLIASAADASPIGEHTLYAARPSRNSKDAVVNLLFTCAILDAGTHVVHQAVVPLQWHRPRMRRICRRHVRSWLRDPAIGDVLQAALRTHVARTQRLTAQTGTALEQRVTALLAAGAPDLHAWQGALFDRRAELRAARRHADDALMQESLARGRERYRHLLSLHTAAPRLAAVWLSGR